jgi:hypothetical protein
VTAEKLLDIRVARFLTLGVKCVLFSYLLLQLNNMVCLVQYILLLLFPFLCSVTSMPVVPVTIYWSYFHLGSSLLKDKNHKGMNALDAATSPAIKALLESVRTEDDEIIEGETTYCPLVPLLLPVMLHSYMDTYQTLHIMNSVKSCMRHDHTKTVHSERKGRPKLKFEYERFLKDYRSYRKLKGVIRSERENSPNNEMIRKLLFLL